MNFNRPEVKEALELNKQGVELCEQGLYLPAIDKFIESINVYSTILARRNLAETRIPLGIELESSFKQLLRIECEQDETGRKEPHHLTVIADAYYEVGRLAEARPYYAEAISRYPKDDKILPELKRRLHKCAVALAMEELNSDG